MANYMLNRQNQDGLTILNKFAIVKKKCNDLHIVAMLFRYALYIGVSRFTCQYLYLFLINLIKKSLKIPNANQKP